MDGLHSPDAGGPRRESSSDAGAAAEGAGAGASGGRSGGESGGRRPDTPAIREVGVETFDTALEDLLSELNIVTPPIPEGDGEVDKILRENVVDMAEPEKSDSGLAPVGEPQFAIYGVNIDGKEVKAHREAPLGHWMTATRVRQGRRHVPEPNTDGKTRLRSRGAVVCSHRNEHLVPSDGTRETVLTTYGWEYRALNGEILNWVEMHTATGVVWGSVEPTKWRDHHRRVEDFSKSCVGQSPPGPVGGKSPPKRHSNRPGGRDPAKRRYRHYTFNKEGVVRAAGNVLNVLCLKPEPCNLI